MLTDEQTNLCKNELLERRKALAAHLEDHFGLKYELIKESIGELSNYDNHPADHGTALYEREKDIALNEHQENEMKDIELALKAMDKGTYGKCEECGKDIPYERLEAMPTTRFCIDHTTQSLPFGRPVEEDVIHPSVNEMETEVDEEESTIFDPEDAWQRVSSWGTSNSPSDFYDTAKDYDDMFFNSDELVGSAELVEGFLLTDMEGNYIGVNKSHEEYEDDLDENGVGSILYD
ncbi:TraR/DksA C4-type zinc finger protein [Aquibacillus sp. 3ASR75-11]|uniref:TraR/DksA C4-type zinc finger protein n=1 Tax=Terrihalobacillus insolitus TaxID=2950438 RepID=A0A9X3WV72_9BACI|nr:TraR/DksA C4-type zinc finger protein [Terrihalobacillus insolitus]MDC3413150.1 TraR/DksA C4-type zinc finger protein [Terrihalobacillus insolitus]MDC3425178.1 TraR/DksA C4-type zinc finger protein [Terrihalobacillus insolitus]